MKSVNGSVCVGGVLTQGNGMSKYNALWEYVRNNDDTSFSVTFAEIKKNCGGAHRPFFCAIQKGTDRIRLVC